MNIFYIDHDPVVAASMMTNKHVVKMILESAQMLSTAHRILDGDVHPTLYKIAYKNHPSTVWTRSSKQNYMWLYRHFTALCDEYTRRYNKTHATDIKLRHLLSLPPSNIADVGFTHPPTCMPDQYKRSTSLDSYRTYYYYEKIKDPSYALKFKQEFSIA